MKRETYRSVKIDLAQSVSKAQKRYGFQEAWEELDEHSEALKALLQARKEPALTQEQLARRMGTTKSAISRLEASLRDEKHSPSFSTLKKYAHACGKKLVVQIV